MGAKSGMDQTRVTILDPLNYLNALSTATFDRFHLSQIVTLRHP